MEISHITLIVQNLAKTTTMLETLFEAEEFMIAETSLILTSQKNSF